MYGSETKSQRCVTMNEQRDKEIVACYIGGKTLEQCGQEFKITRERVRQILRKHGILKHARVKPKVGLDDGGVVKTDGRDEFLGVNISEGDKQALREEAERRGLSMSRLSSDFIKEMLAKLEATREQR